MCLPDFKYFIQVEEKDAIIGYRIWRNKFYNNILISEYQNYKWNEIEGPHEVLDKNSGIYAYYYYYYNYYNYNYNNYNNYNYNYNNYNNNNNNIFLSGIIKQYGKIAIHKIGQRSEYAKINSLFSIRESDADGPKEFINWIKVFNQHINKIAKKYNCNVITWQDFTESVNKGS